MAKIQGMKILREVDKAAEDVEKRLDRIREGLRTMPGTPAAGRPSQGPTGAPEAGADPLAVERLARQVAQVDRKLTRIADDFMRPDPFVTGGTRPLV